MKRFVALLFGLLLLRSETEAAMMGFNGFGGSTTGFVGVGDVVGGATFFYSCTRAYSAAKATANVNACDLRRQSDSAICTVKTASAGNVDYTVGTPCNSGTQTATAWAGTNNPSFTGCIGANSSCNTSGNQLFTAATLSVGTHITGTGVTANTFITAGASSPYTVGVNQTVSTGSTLTATPSTLFVATMYDQTGGNQCGSAACDLVQSTPADQPILLTNCINSMPCVEYNATAMAMTSANTFTPNASATFSLSAVVQQIAISSGTPSIFHSNGTSAYNGFTHPAVANEFELFAGGSGPVGTATDNAWHSINGIGLLGTNATTISVDGIETMASHTPSTSAGAPGTTNVAGSTFYIAEMGFWDNTIFTTTQRGQQCVYQSFGYSLGLSPC